MSYSCLPNLKSVISSHNKKIMNKQEPTSQEKQCNCRNKSECPLDGNCQISNVVYKADVFVNNNENPEKIYIGFTCNKFKITYNSHMSSFQNTTANGTRLTKFIH